MFINLEASTYKLTTGCLMESPTNGSSYPNTSLKLYLSRHSEKSLINLETTVSRTNTEPEY